MTEEELREDIHQHLIDRFRESRLSTQESLRGVHGIVTPGEIKECVSRMFRHSAVGFDGLSKLIDVDLDISTGEIKVSLDPQLFDGSLYMDRLKNTITVL